MRTLTEKIARDVPLSWLCKSENLRRVLSNRNESSSGSNSLAIADFAAGENDEVPYFFHNLIQSCIDVDESISITVYCTDLHTLRIESLFDKLHEQSLTSNTRVVLSRFESMTVEATFPEIQEEFLRKDMKDLSKIDRSILYQKLIPSSCFDIGVLNNDVIGYIHEYYKEYTDAARSIVGIKKVMKPGSLLIVTQPCLLYPMDNISVLNEHGFQFLEGYDVEISNGLLIPINASVEPRKMSRLNHYSILIFETMD